MLLLFLTDGVMCEVGALYLTLTGGSGFFAVLLDELKSLLKLEEEKKNKSQDLSDTSKFDCAGKTQHMPACSKQLK